MHQLGLNLLLLQPKQGNHKNDSSLDNYTRISDVQIVFQDTNKIYHYLPIKLWSMHSQSHFQEATFPAAFEGVHSTSDLQ